jgi:hypothetical protein
MRKNLIILTLLVLAVAFAGTGCDRIKQMLGMGAGGPGQAGPGGAQPYGAPSQPGGAGMVGPGMSPPQALTACAITEFRMGKMKDDGKGNLYVYEDATTIPYVPSTYFGISFSYKSNSGRPVTYREEEYFPYPPQNWTLWEGSEGSYKTFPSENRAVYTTTLTPDSDIFTSYWGFNPSGDPTGQWRWDIYFDNEYYTTVVFNVVPATN